MGYNRRGAGKLSRIKGSGDRCYYCEGSRFTREGTCLRCGRTQMLEEIDMQEELKKGNIRRLEGDL